VSGFILVCLGAMIGAPARYLMDRAIQSRHGSVVPWGTLSINLTGSFALGLLTALGVHHDVAPQVMLLAGTGFCGTFTTYSTFAYEVLRLTENRHLVHAALTVVATVAGGLGAALVGYTCGIVI